MVLICLCIYVCTQCSAELCVSPGVGSEKRAIHCVHYNGSDAHLDLCDAASRPPHKRQCDNQACRPMWKTTSWTQVGMTSTCRHEYSVIVLYYCQDKE